MGKVGTPGAFGERQEPRRAGGQKDKGDPFREVMGAGNTPCGAWVPLYSLWHLLREMRKHWKVWNRAVT